jgi:hypothetical protein
MAFGKEGLAPPQHRTSSTHQWLLQLHSGLHPFLGAFARSDLPVLATVETSGLGGDLLDLLGGFCQTSQSKVAGLAQLPQVGIVGSLAAGGRLDQCLSVRAGTGKVANAAAAGCIDAG